MKFSALAKKYADGFSDLALEDLCDATPEDVLKLRAEVDGDDDGHVFVRVSSDDFVPRKEGREKLPARTFRYTMSTQNAVGHFGDVIVVKGWDLAEFKRRGSPFLYGHNMEEMRHPLGRMSQLKKGDEDDFIRNQPVLAGNATFSDEGISPFNDLTHDMVASNNMPAGSVGFVILDARGPTDEELSADKTLRKWSAIITKARLKEYSSVPLGMDPDSVKRRDAALSGVEEELARAIASGKYDEDLIARFRHAYLGTQGEPVDDARTVVAINGFKREDGTEDANGDATEDTFGAEERTHPGTGEVMEPVEAPADGTEVTLSAGAEDLDDIDDETALALDEIEAENARALLGLEDDEQEDQGAEPEPETTDPVSSALRHADTTTHPNGDESAPDPVDLSDTLRALDALGLPTDEAELREAIANLPALAEDGSDVDADVVALRADNAALRNLIESLSQRVALLEGVLLPESASDDDGDDDVSRAEGDKGDPDEEDVYDFLSKLDDAGVRQFVAN